MHLRHQARGGGRCEIDDVDGTYPDNTCGGTCEAVPPPPPTPGVPCEDDCHCNDYDLSELAKDMKDGMTHHACDKDKHWCFMFSLCGPIPTDELPTGCHDWQADGIAALRYKYNVSCAHMFVPVLIATTNRLAR